jgi:hypothetical protein
MAAILGPKIVRTGLILELDAADINSYIGTGTNWISMVSNDTGTLTNGPTFSSLNGGSIVFDGTNDYILDSSVANFNVGCIDMWIRPTSTINAESTFSNLLQLKIGATDADAWNIAFGSSTSALTNEYIVIADGSSGASVKRTGVTDGGSLSNNTWVNIVFNWESTVYKIYINNTVKTTSAAVGGNVGQLTVPNTYVIGAFQINNTAVYSGFFPGSVAITRLYNRSLTAAEMLQNYNAVKSRFGL